MELTWHGRFCVRLRSRDATVVADPFPADVGPTGRGIAGDIVTYSHDEPHPASGIRQMRKVRTPNGEEVLVPASLEGAFVLRDPGEFEVRHVLMNGVRTDRPTGDGESDDVRNIAFTYELDAIHACHLGDVGGRLDEEQLGEIGSVELLCIPIGGRLSAARAAEIVAQVDPKLVVPLTVESAPEAADKALDRFLHEMGVRDPQPQARLSVTVSTVPDDTTVVLLEPRGRS